MFNKFLLITLLGFLAVNAYNIPNTFDERDLQERNIVTDEILKIFESVKQTVKNAYENIKLAINNVIEYLNDKLGGWIDVGVEHLFEIISGIKDEINKLLAKAQELGIDVKTCIVNEEEDFKVVKDKLINDTTECVLSQKEKAEKVRDYLVNEVKSVYNQIEDSVTKFHECNGFTDCLIGLIGDIYNLATSVPQKVSNIITKSWKFANEAKNEVTKCVSDAAVSAGGSAIHIGQEVIACITDAINSHEKEIAFKKLLLIMS